MNTFPLEDKTVLLTGGLGGIAVGVAKLIVKRGGRILLADVKAESEGAEEAADKVEGGEGKVAYAKCDVTDKEEFEGEGINRFFLIILMTDLSSY